MTLERSQSRMWCSKIGWQTVPCSRSIDGESALTGSSPGARDQQSPRCHGTQLLATTHGVSRHTQVSQVVRGYSSWMLTAGATFSPHTLWRRPSSLDLSLPQEAKNNDYWTSRVAAEGHNPRLLWRSLNNVLRRGTETGLPLAPVSHSADDFQTSSQKSWWSNLLLPFIPPWIRLVRFLYNRLRLEIHGFHCWRPTMSVINTHGRSSVMLMRYAE